MKNFVTWLVAYTLAAVGAAAAITVLFTLLGYAEDRALGIASDRLLVPSADQLSFGLVIGVYIFSLVSPLAAAFFGLTEFFNKIMPLWYYASLGGIFAVVWTGPVGFFATPFGDYLDGAWALLRDLTLLGAGIIGGLTFGGIRRGPLRPSWYPQEPR